MDCSECNLFDSYKSNTVNIMNLINNCGWFSYFLMSYPCEALLLYKSEHNVIFVFFHHSPFFSMVYIPDPNRSLCSFDCYCYFRRVENSKVADRVFIWSSINNIIKFWKKFKTKSKQPVCKNYNIFFDAVDDYLTCAKLSFLSFVAKILEPNLCIPNCQVYDTFLLSRFICSY